jgi:putative DNA primase/helicase
MSYLTLRIELKKMSSPDFLPAALVIDKMFERGDHVELAEELIRRLKKEGEVVYADGQLWKFNCVIFRPVPVEDVSRRVQGLAGSAVRTAKSSRPLAVNAKDVSGVTKLARDRIADPSFFSGAVPGLVFSDAFVRVSAEGIVVEKPSPKHRARFAYDFAYEPARDSDVWFGFLADIFAGDDDVEAKIELLQEYVGVSLLGIAPRFQRALLLKGEGSNGKGVLVRVIESCFPPGSVTAVPPQDWSNEYRRAMIAGKFLNVVAELPDTDILASEAFKAIVAGDQITGRHIREAPFPFRSSAGQIFSVNPPMPSTNDHSHAFWRRWLVLEFNRIVDEQEKDLDLADKIIAERPGIVPWFLEGAQRALARGRLTIPPSSEAALDEWRGQADQILGFLRDCCVSDAEGTKAATLYYDYEQWARRAGHRQMTATRFGMRMKNLKYAPEKRGDGLYYLVKCTQRLDI